MRNIIENIVIVILTLSCLGGITFGVYGLVMADKEYEKSESEYTALSDAYVVREETSEIVVVNEETGEEEIRRTPPYTIDFTSLKEINEDVCGWIVIEGTVVNYPILYSHDNKDYLRTTMEGTWATAGSIFMDCSNEMDFTSINTVLYGHNMKDGSMFKVISYYKDETYYQEHPYIFICTEDRQVRYGVISAHYTTVGSDSYKKTFTEDGYAEWLFNEKELSLYATDCGISEDKPVITLSTCVRSNSSQRFVLVLQEVEVFEIN